MFNFGTVKRAAAIATLVVTALPARGWSQGAPTNPACSISQDRLMANLDGLRIHSLVSVVFNVRNSRKELLFREIVPVVSGATRSISITPMDVNEKFRAATAVDCYLANGLGDSIDENPNCANLGHVDLGTDVTLNSIEIDGSQAFFNLTAAHESGPVLQTDTFRGEPLFVRSMSSPQRVARVLIFGPGTVSVVIGTDLVATGQDLYELGAGAGEGLPSAAVCLRPADHST
jgi:hypothetical protein